MQIMQRCYANGRYGRITTLRNDDTVDIECDDGTALERVPRNQVEVKPVDESETVAVSHSRRASPPPPSPAPPVEAPEPTPAPESPTLVEADAAAPPPADVPDQEPPVQPQPADPAI